MKIWTLILNLQEKEHFCVKLKLHGILVKLSYFSLVEGKDKVGLGGL